jgi:CelD/BcsL family acetyltransferase involved in cellulose biosynthesis
MHTELITQLAQLQAIAGEWNRLALPSPMQSPDWLIPWWQVYGGANRELAVLAIRDDDSQLAGLCPWFVEHRPTGASLRWLGSGAVCSDHAGILVARSASHDVVRAAADWLCDFSASGCTRIAFDAIDSDDRLLEALISGMHQNGWLITDRSEPGTACIELPASWDEYLQKVSKNHRKRCRRLQREFFETERVRTQVATDPAECLQAFEHLVSLHNERRRSIGGRGAFEDPQFRRFHELAIHRLATSGKLQLRLLEVDNQLAAIEYLLTDDTTLYAYQSGLSPYGETISAGTLSMLSLIRDSIDHRRQRIDLLRGTEPYKFSWGAVHRPARTTILRRRSLAAVVESCFDNARERARAWKNSPANPWRKSPTNALHLPAVSG